VRGLTTAASIWITAAIGILAGIGFYFPLAVTTLITIGTLSLFRWIEVMVPGEFYAHLQVRFAPDATMPEDDFRRFIGERGFSIANLSYYYSADARFFEYQMVIRTSNGKNARKLQEALRGATTVLEFRMAPVGD
jgi:putative Mg2+ transporter-C (MgtC) family protein